MYLITLHNVIITLHHTYLRYTHILIHTCIHAVVYFIDPELMYMRDGIATDRGPISVDFVESGDKIAIAEWIDDGFQVHPLVNAGAFNFVQAASNFSSAIS